MYRYCKERQYEGTVWQCITTYSNQSSARHSTLHCTYTLYTAQWAPYLYTVHVHWTCTVYLNHRVFRAGLQTPSVYRPAGSLASGGGQLDLCPQSSLHLVEGRRPLASSTSTKHPPLQCDHPLTCISPASLQQVGASSGFLRLPTKHK